MNIKQEESSLKLQGAKITLRTFTASDITEQYLGWLNDPEVTRYSNQRFVTHTEESSKKYQETFKGSPNLFLLMQDANSNEAIGTMTGYISEEHRTADIGILLGNRNYWGKGMGLDAWSTFMEYLLEERNLRKVTGGTVKSNTAMVRIMERSGMSLEGTRVRQMLYDNKEEDIVLYGKFKKNA